MAYSPFFQTIHDEARPVGRLGRGTHYSVFRAVTWHDVHLNPVPQANVLDFAVIWDEDHDTRVIQVAEALYLAGLLAPVRFIGERKGMLTVLLEQGVFETWDQRQVERYKERLAEQVRLSCESLGDWWQLGIDCWNENGSIISADDLKVSTYLNFILMLWDLGIKAPPIAKQLEEQAPQSA